AQQEAAGAPSDAAPEPEPVAVPAAAADTYPATAGETAEIPVVGGDEAEDGFPIADYDRLRATELLGRLPSLDRNQLEAVRQREAGGKNRFTVMSRIDSLLAAQQDPAWQVADDEWEAEAGTDAESDAAVVEAEALQEEDEFAIALEEEEEALQVEEFVVEEFEPAGEVEDDEVDELVSPATDFPIPNYEALTVGQVLPRLSHLDADQLAQVRGREQQGRARGTILDRIDRLAAKSGAGAVAMPPARPARKAPARKAPVAKAPEAAPRKAPARAKKAPVAPPPPPAAEPVKKSRARKAAAPAEAAIPMPPPAAEPAPAARKGPARARKATAPTPAPPADTPMKAAVKKARAAKATKATKATKTTKATKAAPAKRSTKRT
ncbi:MAG: hypothetical protein ACRD1D_13495, partial [Acidimicrobiales bacterium]